MSAAALADLLAVQDLDLAADQHRHRRSHLPARQALAVIEERLASLQADAALVGSQLAEVSSRQETAEAELSASERRADEVSKRLYGGSVSASRELSAMAAELEQLKARSSAIEDSVLALMEEREPLEAASAALGAEIVRLVGERTEVAAALSGEEAAVDAEIAELQSRRAEAAGRVPAQLLATYEQLRGRLGGVGVARLSANRCDGCHLSLSAVDLDRIRRLPDGEVYTCEQCSRILVPAAKLT